MMPMTPRGTATRSIASPLGRVQWASTRPTGSGSSAIASSPAAIASIRFGSSARRSRKAGERSSASARSLALAARISGARSRTARAASCRAATFDSAEARASAATAARARRPISAIVAARSASPVALRSRGSVSVVIGVRSLAFGHHQIVAMNDLVAPTVAEDAGNFTTLVAGYAPDIIARIGRQSAPGLDAGAGADNDRVAALERTLDRDDAGGQEALAAAQGARRTIVDGQSARGIEGPDDPRLARRTRLATRQE